MNGIEVVPNRMCCAVVGLDGAIPLAGCASPSTMLIAEELTSLKSFALLADVAHATR